MSLSLASRRETRLGVLAEQPTPAQTAGSTNRVKGVATIPQGKITTPIVTRFCPSCGARRMGEIAALLVDEMSPGQSSRPWVAGVPHPLRVLFASRAVAHPGAEGSRPAAATP